MSSGRAGLRLQIITALFALMVVLFFPLFFAVTIVLAATLREVRAESARGLGRAIAAHVAEAGPDLARVMEDHVGKGGAFAIGVWDRDGRLVQAAGEGRVDLDPQGPGRVERTRIVRAGPRLLVETVLLRGDLVVVTRVAPADDTALGARVVKLLALYMSLFALALLVFAYISITRLVVRPVEELGEAARRVAGGVRELEVPIGGAREVDELGASLQTMTQTLLANDEALRAKVTELTRATEELRRTQKELVKSEHLASVGRLGAGVAHEIGNPITAILGMHDMMEDELTSEERKDLLSRMRKETERISGIVRDLLDFARPESNPPPSLRVFEPLGVKSAIDDVLGMARAREDLARIELVTEIDDPTASVPLASARLVQVLLNLTLNAGAAAKAMPKPRIVLRVRAATGDRVRLEVEDNGPGVPAELRERIFLPFVTTKEIGQGTGLGLSVCRGLVEAAGGQIHLDVDYTEGARFIVDLPRVKEDPAGSASASGP